MNTHQNPSDNGNNRVRSEKELRKKKSFFNSGRVIDCVIIILILSAICSIGFRLYSKRNPRVSEELQTYEIYFRMDGLSFMVPTYFHEGDSVYFQSSGELFGTLLNEGDSEGNSALNASPAIVTVQDDSGAYIAVQYPDESVVDAVGCLRVSGTVSSDGTFLLGGSTPITPGMSYRVYTKLVDFALIVTSIGKQ